jgi:hypothetical protein
MAALAVGVVLSALFLTRNVGYLFEADSPWMLTLPNSLEWEGEPGPAASLRWTHSQTTPFLHAGFWWPRLSVRVGDDSLPIVTEAYQGGWLYWPFKLLPRDLRTRETIRMTAALLGGLTLVLALLAFRTWWGEMPLLLAGLLACNSMFLLSFGFGYLYEALPMAAVLAAVLAGRKVRERPTAAGVLLVGFLAGLAGGLKLTALPAALTVAGVLLGKEALANPRRAGAFVLGIFIPLLPFVVSEATMAVAGGPSPLLSALGGGKGGFSDPAGMVSGFAMASVWTAALPAGNGYILPMLSSGTAPAAWLLGLSAAVCLPGLAAAVLRLRRGIQDPLRDAVLAAWAVVLLLSGLLYKSGFDFQAFMTIHPLAASLVVRSLILEGRHAGLVRIRCLALGLVGAFVAVVLLHTGLSFAGGAGVSTIASLTAQQEIAGSIPADRQVVTTSYNQAGMLRMMSGGRVDEINMDRLLSPGGDEAFFRQTVRHAFAEVTQGHPDALYLFDLAPLPIDESREHTQFGAGISSRQVVAEEFVQAVREAGMYSKAVAVGRGDSGTGVYALVELKRISGL